MNIYTKDIAVWNLVRNDLKLDLKLENAMLREEFIEFLEAETPVDAIDALCDFIFVYEGTNVKVLAAGALNPEQTVEVEAINVYASKCVDHMESFLRYEFLDFSETTYNRLLNLSLGYVVDANNAKPIDKTSHKVIKGTTWVDPKAKIEALITALALESIAPCYMTKH